jgi:hypothetical protein
MIQEAWNYTALVNRNAQNLAGLPKNDGERHAIQKANKDRPRQKIGERAEPQKACRHAEKSGEKREHHRERALIANGEWCDGCGDQCTGGSIRTYNQREEPNIA